MGSIRILSDQLVNQIAAGEVIERPASVVKELVENSIDAQAKTITIEITKGGTESIVITDDGLGMDEMDARLAFERHATSKIQSLDDLFRIRSLGFRGEALASIASVSKITLQTKMSTSLSGTRLNIEGGKILDVSTIACPVGTKFEIQALFYNTPARKKYLKGESTEYRHILETVQNLALAHPEIQFRFVSNGRLLFDLLKTDKVLPRISSLFGKNVAEEMVEVFYGGRDLQVSGYVGKPHTARSTRKYQYFILNGRPVNDSRLGYAVKDAYSNTIPSSQYPLFVLSLTIDPSKVDVNVHPRKLEVRFADPQEIFRVLKTSVHSAMERTSLTPHFPLRSSQIETPAFLRKASIVPTPKRQLTMEECGGTYDPELQDVAGSMSSGSAGSFSFGRSPYGNLGSDMGTMHRSGGTNLMNNKAVGAGSVGLTSNPLANTAGSLEATASPTPSSLGSNSMGSDDWNARKAYLLQRRAERMGQAAPSSGGPVSSIFQNPSTNDGVISENKIFPAVASFTETFNQNRLSEPKPIMDAFTEPYNQDRLSATSNSLRPLAQVRNSYLIAEEQDGLVIIDQHAAHERVMLAKFRAQEHERESTKQQLLTPIQLDLDYRERAILEENLELLQGLGFELNEFGGNTYTVDAVPDVLAHQDIAALMKGFIDDLLNDQPPQEAHRRHEHILHTLACRAAAKFGRRLNSYEQQALLDSLKNTEDSSACAHGRPTMIRLTFEELARQFGRK